MKRYRVVLDAVASEDINDALQWLTERAPEKVSNWFDTLEQSIHSLETFPERCGIAPENGKWSDDFELRHLLFDKFPSVYRVIFTIIRAQ